MTTIILYYLLLVSGAYVGRNKNISDNAKTTFWLLLGSIFAISLIL